MESSETLGRRELLSEKAFGIYEERVYIRRNQTWKKETMSWENFALRMNNPCEIPLSLKLPLHHLQMWESKKGIKRRTKKERQKNAFVVFHAPENIKRKCSNKKCKNRKVRENIFFSLQKKYYCNYFWHLLHNILYTLRRQNLKYKF